MATPPRLVELRCPACGRPHWQIDCDFRGMDPDEEVPYERRAYHCPHCATRSDGFQVGEKSPPAFFLQPHPLYPMDRYEFDHWVNILREHFPEHPLLRELGRSWRPGKV